MAISKRAFPSGAERVYLASGQRLADALSAGIVTDGPILLLPPNGAVPAAVRSEIARLAPKSLVAVGGPQALSERMLRQAAGTIPTSRLAGDTRYGTSVAVSRHVFGGTAKVAYMANGHDSPDAVVGGTVTDGPVLLLPRGTAAPQEVQDEIARLAPGKVTSLGGPAAVSDAQLRAAAGGRANARLAGQNRTETSVAVANYVFPGAAQTVYLARGDVFADAVAAGTLTNGPIILVPGDGSLPSSVSALFKRLKPTEIVGLGGPGAVPDAVLRAAQAAAIPAPTTPTQTPTTSTPPPVDTNAPGGSAPAGPSPTSIPSVPSDPGPVDPVPTPGADAGAVRVRFSAPDGVPANVHLTASHDYVAPKQLTGAQETVTVTVAPGQYTIDAPTVTHEGKLYMVKPSVATVSVAAGQTETVDVELTQVAAVTDVHATNVALTSIEFGWKASGDNEVVVRRGPKDAAPQTVTAGTSVPVKGASATDDGLTPGTSYAYSVFVRHGGDWLGPIVFEAGTTTPEGSTEAAYVASPTAVLPEAKEVTQATSTGNGVRVVTSGSVEAPLVGSGVVLPVSDALPGGYVGVVADVGQDGHTLTLAPGGIADAFDLYSLSVPDMSVLPVTERPAANTGESALSHEPPQARSAPETPLSPEREAWLEEHGLQSPQDGAELRSALKASKFPLTCDPGASFKADLTPKFTPFGHFSTTVDKYGIFGQPASAKVDLEAGVKTEINIDVESAASAGCSLEFPEQVVQISSSPVPMVFSNTPELGAEAEAAVKLKGVNVTLRTGAKASGTFGVNKPPSFTGDIIREANVGGAPEDGISGKVGVNAGTALAIGPGVGTPVAGVFAGLQGTLTLFKAEFAADVTKDSACLTTTIGGEAQLGLFAKAWLGSLTAEAEWNPEFLNAPWNVPGSPWDLPKGCSLVKPEPAKDVTGPGVEVVSDATEGSGDQFGHIGGFAPGEKAWVLSTGRMSDIQGAPSQFASTDMGAPGFPMLSSLAGYGTRDAAAYTLKVKPTGRNLHVRYAFASEEYPEYVGSTFNDVMAITVDGTNCALVPGTSDPVSVNTVNQSKNSEYWVDNSTGASGYDTAMDGITKPLTCSVPVTPGKEVTVTVSVADASDGIYDSAVALLDGGVWSDDE